MTIYKSAMRGVPHTLLDLVTTGIGSPLAVNPAIKHHTFTIKPTGTIATGAVQLESASSPDYTGTWNPIGGGPIALTTDTELQFQFEGIFPHVRARVTTNVTGAGGKVSVEYVGN